MVEKKSAEKVIGRDFVDTTNKHETKEYNQFNK